MALRTLDASAPRPWRRLCELIVPGSSRVGPVVYVDALLTGMPPPVRDGALAAIDALAPAAAQGADALAEHVQTPEFGFVRALAIEAYYSRLRRAGQGRAGSVGGDRLQLAARDAPREGLVVPGDRMKERFDVVVVGSGAGGGVVAGELAQRGRDVLLLECGPHLRAADFTRWEAKASARPLLAAPVRAASGRRARHVPRRPLRRRDDDDQHEGRLARPRARRREVACRDGADERRRRAVLGLRPRAVLRPRRAGARRARADRLAEERAHGRAGLPRARRRARAGSRVHGRELHALRLLPPGLRRRTPASRR